MHFQALHVVFKEKGNANTELPFFVKQAYNRYLTSVLKENKLEIGKSLSDCKELASRLSGTFVGAAITKNKAEIIKIVKDGIEFAFSDAPDLLTFLELALIPFVSKLPSADVLDMYVCLSHFFQSSFLSIKNLLCSIGWAYKTCQISLDLILFFFPSQVYVHLIYLTSMLLSYINMLLR